MRSVIRNGLSPAADGVDYLFEMANRNKRGIALDVTVPAGRAVFERLVRWADVYITNQLPRVRRKLHTEPDDLFALNAKLVFAKGHGQGQRGADAEAGGFDSGVVLVAWRHGPHADRARCARSSSANGRRSATCPRACSSPAAYAPGSCRRCAPERGVSSTRRC